MLTNDGLIEERSHLGGVQRLYRWGDMGLSLVNAPMLHAYAFAWEAAVFRYTGDKGVLDYSTELTSDVEVFATDEEANAFIKCARVLFTPLTHMGAPISRADAKRISEDGP